VHVRLVAPLLASRTAEALSKAEGLLVEQAHERTFCELERIVAYFYQHADPDGSEEAAEARRARRDVLSFPRCPRHRGHGPPAPGPIVSIRLPADRKGTPVAAPRR
jgi:hypothetical protein